MICINIWVLSECDDECGKSSSSDSSGQPFMWYCKFIVIYLGESMFSRSHKFLISLCLLLTISACGGGGGGNDDSIQPVASSQTFPLSLILQNWVKENASFPVSISGTATDGIDSIPISGTGSFSVSNVESTFEGQKSIKRASTTTGSLNANGINVPVADTSFDYFDLNYQPIGHTAVNAYCIYANQSIIPISSKVGDTNSWFTGTCYSSDTKSIRISTTSVSYVLEPDTSSTALLKIIQKITDSSGNVGTTLNVYRVYTSGLFSRISESGSLSTGGLFVNLTVSF